MIIENEQLKQLGNYIFAGVEQVGCDGTLFFTQKWLAEHHVENASAVVELLEETGGFCDCEVLFNAMGSLLEDEEEDEGENVDQGPDPSTKMYQLTLAQIYEEKNRLN